MEPDNIKEISSIGLLDKVCIAGRIFAILPGSTISKLCIDLETVNLILKVDDNTSRLYTNKDERVYDIPVEFDTLIGFINDSNILNKFSSLMNK